MGDSSSSISDEDVSAFTFSTRGSFGLLTPSASGCPMRSSPGLERMIQAILPRKRSRQTRSRWPSSSGLGPRADRLNAAALGAVSRSAYFIGTRAPSRPPERGGPRGSVPVGLHHWDSA